MSSQSVPYEVVSAKLCPFVQRTIIVLEEKQLRYSARYIDLEAKPDWFLAISPHGKVPILKAGDVVLFESAAINEYLNDAHPEPPMHPADPLLRARHRALIESFTQLSLEAYKLMTLSDEAGARQAADNARALFARIEGVWTWRGHGRYLGGERLSLLDAAAAPALQRLHWIDGLEPSFGLFEKSPAMRALKDALLETPSVTRSLVENVESLFRDYLAGGGSPHRQKPPAFAARSFANPEQRG